VGARAEAGRVARRPGRTKVINGTAAHSLWRHDDFPYALYADGDSIYAFTTALQRQFVTDGLSPGLPVSFAKINDAVLAVCAGGLRRYLEANEEPPEQERGLVRQRREE
jgi:hypothetical protein